MLAACGHDMPLVTIVTREPKPIVVAPECDPARDPKWASPPDADERLREAARREEHNGDSFDDITDARKVCWASLRDRVTTGETSNQAADPQ